MKIEPAPPPADPLIETRRWQIEQICKAFGVPPSVIDSDYGRAARNFHQALRSYEQAADDALLAWIETQEGKAP